MAKLYFKYCAMGSSKSTQALITHFNYKELGLTVWLIKPSVDNRDGANIIRSRIGLQREGASHPSGQGHREHVCQLQGNAEFPHRRHSDIILPGR
jgi:Thymidine kinase